MPSIVVNLPRQIVAVLLLVAVASVAVADEPVRTYKRDLSNLLKPKSNYTNQDLSETNFENSDFSLSSFQGAVLVRSNFQGCSLKACSFNNADLTECDLRFTALDLAGIQDATMTKVNMAGLDLRGISLQRSRLMGANLSKARGFSDVSGANFSGADFRGADLSQMNDYGNTPIFRGAQYDQFTRWPPGFDPASVGAKFVETVVEPAKPIEIVPAPGVTPAPVPSTPVPTPVQPGTNAPAPSAVELTAEFTKLDTNADGVLSGKEAKPYATFDVNQDGDITQAEFVAGRSKAATP